MLLSSGKVQVSFEDVELKQGIFTYALTREIKVRVKKGYLKKEKSQVRKQVRKSELLLY